MVLYHFITQLIVYLSRWDGLGEGTGQHLLVAIGGFVQCEVWFAVPFLSGGRLAHPVGQSVSKSGETPR